jgi:hypothetical protein
VIIRTCVLQLQIVYVPVLRPVFKTQQLSGHERGMPILPSCVRLLIIRSDETV